MKTHIGYEPLKARITKTSDGFPVELKTAQEAYGDGTTRSPDDGWFWIFATPRSAADIRRRGLHAVGTETTTFIPPQTAVGVDSSITANDIPVVGSPEHTRLMLEESEDAA